MRLPILVSVCLMLFAAGSTRQTVAEDTSPPAATLVVVVGAEGTPEYGEQFRQWARRWQEAAEQAKMECHVIGIDGPRDQPDRELLQMRLQAESQVTGNPLWLVLIGHGTYFGDVAKFNARGADFDASELSQWLSVFDRPVAIINCTSSSAPFLNQLSASNRVVITATRSGAEQNYARFGGAMSQSITDPAADLDHDRAVSLLEAFLHASDRVTRFYEQEARLATEHALLDDNGDGLGTPSTFFHGVRAVKTASDGALPDGRAAKRWVLVPSEHAAALSAEQQTERDRLEAELERLRDKQASLSETEYLDQLEAILVPLARCCQNAQHVQ